MDTVNIPTSALELFLPEDILQWFDLIGGEKKKGELYFTLEEKNDPHLPDWYNNEKIISKGFRNITIGDFPIRGKRTHLVFRRRTWQIE